MEQLADVINLEPRIRLAAYDAALERKAARRGLPHRPLTPRQARFLAEADADAAGQLADPRYRPPARVRKS